MPLRQGSKSRSLLLDTQLSIIDHLQVQVSGQLVVQPLEAQRGEQLIALLYCQQIADRHFGLEECRKRVSGVDVVWEAHWWVRHEVDLPWTDERQLLVDVNHRTCSRLSAHLAPPMSNKRQQCLHCYALLAVPHHV